MRLCPVCGESTPEERCPADGTATIVAGGVVRDPLSYKAGEVIIGRYEIQSALRRGGFGAVYVARHTGTGQQVAIKMLSVEQAAGGDDVIRRFYREARVTAGLTSQNTVRVFDVGQADSGPLFLVMELLRGSALDTVLRDLQASGKRMSESDAIDIGIAILKSLAEAHSAGLVHRDLKPSNIMLSRAGDDEMIVKVLDFGIAQANNASKLTAAGKALGTPAFMSPEQICGRALDGRSDLYSLGVLLFLCVCGRLPFDAVGGVAIAQMHMKAPLPDIAALAPEVSQAFIECLQRALAKKPEARYPDARAMRQALQAIRGGAWAGTPAGASQPATGGLSGALFVREQARHAGHSGALSGHRRPSAPAHHTDTRTAFSDAADYTDTQTAFSDAADYTDTQTAFSDAADYTDTQTAFSDAADYTDTRTAFSDAADYTDTQTAFSDAFDDASTAPAPTELATAYDPSDFDSSPSASRRPTGGRRAGGSERRREVRGPVSGDRAVSPGRHASPPSLAGARAGGEGGQSMKRVVAEFDTAEVALASDRAEEARRAQASERAARHPPATRRWLIPLVAGGALAIAGIVTAAVLLWVSSGPEPAAAPDKVEAAKRPHAPPRPEPLELDDDDEPTGREAQDRAAATAPRQAPPAPPQAPAPELPPAVVAPPQPAVAVDQAAPSAPADVPTKPVADEPKPRTDTPAKTTAKTTAKRSRAPASNSKRESKSNSKKPATPPKTGDNATTFLDL